MGRTASQRKVQPRRAVARVLRAVGLLSRVDVVAQQVLDHENDDIFRAVRSNNLLAAIALIDADPDCLLHRDSVGVGPVHAAFLFGHQKLGKEIVRRRPDLAALQCGTLDDTDGRVLSPYEGENILHIAIVRREARLARWLVRQIPELLEAETIGSFFGPSKPCYFGGTPFLFAVSSNQIDVALELLAAGERAKKERSANSGAQRRATERRRQQLQLLQEHSHRTRPKRSMMAAGFNTNKRRTLWTSKRSVAAGNAATADDEDGAHETSVFMTDRFGNSALHLAVLHDLPDVYDFAVAMAMRVLSDPHFSIVSFLIECERAAKNDTTTQEDAKSRRARQLKVIGDRVMETEGLSAFMRRVDDVTYARMKSFLMHRNEDELTPLSLAAAVGNQRMLQHIIQQQTTVAWTYGPIAAVNVPLLDLEEPELRDDNGDGILLKTVDRLLRWLPYPFSPKRQNGYITAIQCLCSYERLSSSIHKNDLNAVLVKRLDMLQMKEIRSVLRKKWKYVGRERFMRRLWIYVVFLATFNVSTLFQTAHYRNKSAAMSERVLVAVADVICYGFALTRFFNEVPQLIFSFQAYVSEAGAGRLDNVCTLVTSSFLFLSGVSRVLDQQDLTDAFTAVALVFAWFYLLFFLMGFRSTGPFVIMILTMIQHDFVRFVFVYIAVMAGFSQALYLVHDGRAEGLAGWLHRVRLLVITGFTGEVNYDDNYTSGRMNALTQSFMFGYIVLVMILLVNLLIAMMGNTYSEILAQSEQRWVAERANIMTTIENQCPDNVNHILRCFPHCCPEHMPRCYCGCSLHVLVTFDNIRAVDMANLAVCVRFETEERSAAIQHGHVVSFPRLPPSVVQDDSNDYEWILAEMESEVKQREVPERPDID
ncbi:hypothetical protein P43SY_004051 [Pythium insidiosum]|uniref:Ion transport domain-containing protein n=1 Tax=Pythium insidiosum TaxID=114742 RepID=A0AAD5Q3D1_PYTIN|nr:hypothetical protein P43SY_004051 [Pythium insidiosum]